MKKDTPISRRGVYYDLTVSPYEYNTPYGELFKFSSAKKLEIYSRDVMKEIDRLHKLIDRNGMRELVPDELIQFLIRCVYKAFYRKIEG